ncbi:MAG: glycosyltransferase family 39 protein [Acidobacteriaceae bacterium]|nr:glycosyltransferase family 39 protein [Acidobacteriaceae bacterium]
MTPPNDGVRRWLHRLRTAEAFSATQELVVLFLVTSWLLAFGLIPFRIGHLNISRTELGLVGADEPRYAQVAREMLQVHSAECHALHTTVRPHSLAWKDLTASYHCLTAGAITPILYGVPWLEKPALYYWRAMSFFKEFGISDWSARLPSTTATFALILLIYLHMRRFRPGGHLDAALITASCIAMVAFSRGASTDMQLAAPFSIGMLGWYAWYETGKKFWLFDLYFFGGAATLAKGPIAPFMILCILLLFAGLRREWNIVRRTIWLPGVALYLAMVLPWFIAVQLRNPDFYRLFFLQHNLERFATDRYQHHQPIYYYLVVLILGLMPWTVLSLRAMVDSIQISVAEWRVRHNRVRYVGNTRPGDAFPEFLVIWAIFPVLFFTFSGSKLPGYILPAIAPITILTGDYLYRIRQYKLKWWMLGGHALVVSTMTFVLLLCPQYMIYERFVPAAKTIFWAALWAIVTGVVICLTISRWGTKYLRTVTLAPVLAMLFFLLRMNGWLLDANYSARPLAERIAQEAPDIPTLATYHIRRDMDYGLAFYRNQPLRHYFHEESVTEKVNIIAEIPQEQHILVLRERDIPQLSTILAGRVYTPLFLYEWQGLAVYRVSAGTQTANLSEKPSVHNRR